MYIAVQRILSVLVPLAFPSTLLFPFRLIPLSSKSYFQHRYATSLLSRNSSIVLVYYTLIKYETYRTLIEDNGRGKLDNFLWTLTNIQISLSDTMEIIFLEIRRFLNRFISCETRVNHDTDEKKNSLSANRDKSRPKLPFSRYLPVTACIESSHNALFFKRPI